MKTVKVLVAASMAAALLAGCGSKTDTDTFRFASELDIQGMDSTVVDDGMSYNAIHAITDGLTAVNDKGKTVPALAKSWDVSADGKTYTFHLKDAKWSNGDKVTANDFVYSWKRIIKNAGNYAYMLGDDGASVKNASQLIDLGPKATDEQMNTLGVKATDDKTLVVELNNKVPYFTDLMAFPCYFPQNEKFVEKCGKNYGTKPEYTLSNGAYTMTKWIKGNKATFTKNDKYYDAKTVATKNLEMYLVQDPKTAAQNFDNGKVDYATINSTLVDKYKGKDTFTTFNEGYLFYLQLNFKNNTIANKNVREALAYAINRKDLCENVLKDGSKAATGFVPSQLSTSPAGKDFRDDADKYVSYDQKKAQEYLDAAKKELGTENLEALKKGIGNLTKHIENIKKFGLPCIVAINAFPTDTEAELKLLDDMCKELNVEVSISEVWAKGGEGGIDLANKLLNILDTKESHYAPIYSLDMPIDEKIKTIAKEIYGADDVVFTKKVANKIKKFTAQGLGDLPICIAKTQYSLSDDATLLGRPEGFKVTISDLIPNTGSGFLVAISGNIMRMPGLPKVPAANNMDIDEEGKITGLF